MKSAASWSRRSSTSPRTTSASSIGCTGTWRSRRSFFLQLNGTSTESMLRLLSVTAMKVKLMADHFVKVRAIIKDLIQKLEDDAEATHKVATIS